MLSSSPFEVKGIKKEPCCSSTPRVPYLLESHPTCFKAEPLQSGYWAIPLKDLKLRKECDLKPRTPQKNWLGYWWTKKSQHGGGLLTVRSLAPDFTVPSSSQKNATPPKNDACRIACIIVSLPTSCQNQKRPLLCVLWLDYARMVGQSGTITWKLV